MDTVTYLTGFFFFCIILLNLFYLLIILVFYFIFIVDAVTGVPTFPLGPPLPRPWPPLPLAITMLWSVSMTHAYKLFG